MDLSTAFCPRANLFKANLNAAKLVGAYLDGAGLSYASLERSDLSYGSFGRASFDHANLISANLRGSFLRGASLDDAKLAGANLCEADIGDASLWGADLTGANLQNADLSDAELDFATLAGADLTGADLCGADLYKANFEGAKLNGVDLRNANLSEANFSNADLSDSRVYGVAAWKLNLDGAIQKNLIITEEGEPTITVDNVEVAQFVYLLLHNEKIRDLIDTVGRKGVLLLGRFSEGRLQLLERLRGKLRELGFVPMVFNFDKPETKDFTETVRLLASLSCFVIADITKPRSTPLELQATVPDCMVPFVPILEGDEEPFSMFADLWLKHRDWVLDPIRYRSIDRLIERLEAEVVEPAKMRFEQLLAKRTERLIVRDI
ncbi:uncharacterized protein YjbI with pentapeptide repeats [Bradyrhizobium sp. AZCC 1678]|uniref:pentapeptide repeat-containing protein n=1 Tax=Bradyrhizobium sp. AZCC 1678 TaxID=3117030 RepID=UPI002FF33E8B